MEWIVKTSGRVVGPYSTGQLKVELLKRHISVIDEIKKPKGRWTFLREHPELAGLLDEVRRQLELIKEDTKTPFAQTQTDVEVTPLPPPIKLSQEAVTNTVKVGLKQEPPAPLPTPKKYVFDEAPAAPKNSFKKRRQQKSTVQALLWIAVGLTAAAALVLLRQNLETPALLSKGDLATLAEKYYEQGQDSKAAEFYSEILKSAKSQDASLKLRAAQLMLALEDWGRQGKIVLETVDTSQLMTAQQVKDFNLLNAAISLSENQIERALRYLQAAGAGPEYEVNRYIVAYLRESAHNLNQPFANPPSAELRDFVSLLQIKSQFSKLKFPNQKLEMETLLEKSLALSETSYFFKPQALMMKAFFEKNLEKGIELQATLENLINEDPDWGHRLRYDARIANSLLKMSEMVSLCDSILEINSESAVAKAFRSLCDYHRGDLTSAQQTLEAARVQYPQNKSLLGLQAFFFSKAGRVDEALSVVKFASGFASPLLARVGSDICFQRGDLKCVRDLLAPLSKKSLGPVYYELHATLDLRQNDQLSAKYKIDQGLTLYPLYLPLMELKGQLNE
ncbi:MAG: hypothetical protein LW875_11070 [Proteobacteria bacterium]|nr:hypothetical protein [Pseudomonadota bacterium]